MKIICDACSAKYAIANEKVAGKVFKIRCKRCSNIIVVRGMTEGADAPEEAAAYDSKATRAYGYDEAPSQGEEDVWYLVIDQEQIGPLSETEVRRRFAQGEVDAETYTWREGFADWSPLATIEPFTDLASAAQAPSGGAAASMFGGVPGGDDGATMRSDAGDLFGQATADAGGDDAAGDLFGSAGGASDSLFGGGNGAGAGMAMSAESERRLRGERNENSVLFSLNNLAALASDSARPAARPSAPSALAAPVSPGPSRTTAGGEGSGLIDIRSMAQVYHEDKKGPASGMGGSLGSGSDLPVFGGPSFVTASPILLPTQQPAASNNKTLYIMFGVIGALALAAIVLVVMVLRGGGTKEVVVADTSLGGSKTEPGDDTTPGDKSKPDGDENKAGNSGTDDSNGAAKPPENTDKTAPPGDNTGTKPTSNDTGKKPGTTGKKPGSGSSSDKDKDKDKDKATDTKPEDKPDTNSGGCMDEVGCLLADKPPPCCSKYTGSGKKSGGTAKTGGGASNLPENLSKTDIKDGMSRVRDRVADCGKRYQVKGQVKLSIKVAPSGSVSSVDVSSTPSPELGNCVASAVRRASFPKSQQGQKFSYPFVF